MTNHDPIRILIVDDHRMLAESLSEVLDGEPDMEVVGVAVDAKSGELMARKLEPDVVLMDHRLPDGDGIQLTRRIRTSRSETMVVMLTAAEGANVLLAAIEAGCSGFLTKSGPASDVVSAVRLAHWERGFIPPATLSQLLPFLKRSLVPSAVDLTPREIEVLALLAEGASNQQIAAKLEIAVNTVRNHVQSVLAKMDAHTKLEAVVKGLRLGIIDL